MVTLARQLGRRSRLTSIAAVAAIAATSAACSLLVSVDGLEGSAAAPLDASRADSRGQESGADGSAAADARGAADADALDGTPSDADAAPAELHPNGTFESGLVPWVGYLGSVMLDTTARSGMHSLRACAGAASPSDNVFSGDDSGSVKDPVVGATYRATAWVRTDAGGAAKPPGINLLLRTINLGPFAQVEKIYTPASAITPTWTMLQADLVVTKPAQALNVAVVGQYAAGACFLIDDVSLVRLK